MTKNEKILDLIKFIEQDDTKQWYTIKDMSQISGLTEGELMEVVSKDATFLRSTHLSDNNLARFTTQKDFDEKGSFMSKMLGAFKNRID